MIDSFLKKTPLNKFERTSAAGNSQDTVLQGAELALIPALRWTS